MPPESHALLGASSAERWLNCPPSARLTESMPDRSSDDAEKGRLAHEIAEFKARHYFLETLSKRTYGGRMKKFQSAPYYEAAMESSTALYLDHLKARAMSYPTQPSVALEVRVDYSAYVPGGFGTADCVMVGSGCLDVVDYKNGAGVLVEAEGNVQMLLYALGALQLYTPIFGGSIDRIHLSIVQPNAGGIREWETSVAEVQQWAEAVVRPTALLAWEGRGEFASGEWCRFCKAKAQCSARAKAMLELEPQLGTVPLGDDLALHGEYASLLTDTQVGEILTRGRELAAWVKHLEEYALRATLSGHSVLGWKAVEGRGSREWIGGTDQAFSALQQRGVQESILYERKPVTVAGLEKVLGKKTFEETAQDLWAKTPGKPTLVPIEDNRPPYNPAEAAFGVAQNG